MASDYIIDKRKRALRCYRQGVNKTHGVTPTKYGPPFLVEKWPVNFVDPLA